MTVARFTSWILLLALCMTVVVPAGAAPNAERELLVHKAHLDGLNGDVKVSVNAGKDWVPAVAKMSVKKGDMIRTGANSSCRIVISDVGMTSLGAQTTVTVEDLRQVESEARSFLRTTKTVRDDISLSLTSGTLKNSFNRPAGRTGNYSISTPVAVAGVRGTLFELSYQDVVDSVARAAGKSGKLVITVVDGKVEMSGPGGWKRNVTAGEYLNVLQGATPGEPQPAVKEVLDQLKSAFEAEATAAALEVSASGANMMTLDAGNYTDVANLKFSRMFIRKKRALTIENPADAEIGADGLVRVATGGTIRFGASGGRAGNVYHSENGTPRAGSHRFSIAENNSGGSIEPVSGLYTAGMTGGVADKIQLTDATSTVSAGVFVTAIAAVDWPGGTAPTTPVASLPFVVAASMTANTATPAFTWPQYPGAATYTLYLSRSPFSVDNTILARDLPMTRFQMTAQDGSELLRDARSYSFLVIPKNAAGNFMMTPPAGFLSSFTVQLAPPPRVVADGAIEIVSANLNGYSSTSFERMTLIDREKAPDGTLTISGRVSNGKAVTAASISVDNGATYLPLTYDASTGDFTFTLKLAENTDYRFLFKFNTAAGPAEGVIRKMDGDLEILRYINLTQVQRIKLLLDTLRDAYLQNDRAKLLTIIDRDFISPEPGFVDYQQFENSIRDQFNKTTTSFCRWSSEQIEIVTPDKFLIVTFQWARKSTTGSFDETRDYSATVRLELRKTDGQWLIKKDLDGKLFVNDFGLIPAPPD